MRTLLSNLKHDARNGKYVHIGGGRFTPAEIAKAVREIELALTLLQDMTQLAFDATQYDENDECKAQNMARITKANDFLKGVK